MPLLVTMGMGSASSSCTPFNVVTVTPSAHYLDLTFNTLVGALQLQAADPTYWVFSTSGPTQIQAISMQVSGSTVRIYHTEPRAGDTYILTMPENGLRDVINNPYNGSDTQSFVAVAESPVAAQAQSLDERHVRVIYSEPVRADDAVIASNYSITPPLAVVSVAEETSSTYVITTGPQVGGTSYLVTIVNVRDLAGNPV